MSVLASMVVACDAPTPQEEPHPGVPMEMRLEDGLSKARLMAIARYYYPSMEYAQLRYSGAESALLEKATPQWQARYQATAAAMANRGPWQEDLAKGGQWYREATLLDLLMSDRW